MKSIRRAVRSLGLQAPLFVWLLTSLPVWGADDAPTQAEREAVRALAARGASIQIDGEYHVVSISSFVFGVGGSSSSLTDADLVHLAALPHLQSLSLRGTGITAAGLEHLRGLSQLRRLSLDAGGVTEQGVAALRQALPNCTITYRSASDFRSSRFGTPGNQGRSSSSRELGSFGAGFSPSLTTLYGQINQINRLAVQTELGLSREQAVEVEQLRGETSEVGRRLFEQLRLAANAAERERIQRDIQRELAEVNQARDRKLGTILSEAQRARLEQLRMQAFGITALTQPEVAARLQLSEQQTAQLAEQERQRPRITFGPERDLEQIRAALQTWTAGMLSVLSEEQRRKWEETLGEPLAVTDDQTARQIFRYLDDNGDGELSADEWEEHPLVRTVLGTVAAELTIPADVDAFVAVYLKSREAATGEERTRFGDRRRSLTPRDLLD